MRRPTSPLATSLPTAVAAAMIVWLAGVVHPANAATLTFDFGLLGASTTAGGTGTACASNCVIGGAQEQFFTTGGISIGAIGYDSAGAVAYVTQKPGAFSTNGGETGIGESNTYPTTSDVSYEVETTTWLLIDNTRALNAGYLSSSIAIESMQTGEGGHIYAYSGPLTALDTSKLTLLASLENPSTAASPTQSVSVPNKSGYLVVQAYGSPAANITVANVVLNTQPVPEPASFALLALGLTGIGILRRRQPERRGI